MKLAETTYNATRAVQFVGRNPGYSAQHVRALPTVIRAMNAYRAAHPRCAWCGGPNPEVHHVKPVHLFPDLAADADNFISLCRKRRCHLCVGHMTNFGRGYNENVRATCATVPDTARLYLPQEVRHADL